MTRTTHRTVVRDGIGLHVVEQGEGPLVVLVHGMPELSYSWRHQLDALSAAGYRATALDLRGIGRSDRPRDPSGYGLRQLVDDVIAVIHDFGAERAALVGHDWGANVVWHAAARYPERVAALAVLSIPYKRRLAEAPGSIGANTERFFVEALASAAPAGDHAALRQAFYRFLYALSGDAPRELAQEIFRGPRAPDPDALRRIEPPTRLPGWLDADDLDVYVREYARTGFDGVIGRYRSFTRDWEESADIADRIVAAPTLFVSGDREPALMFGSLEPMKALVPNLREVVILPGGGHWIQQERALEVNAALVGFLAKEYPTRRDTPRA